MSHNCLSKQDTEASIFRLSLAKVFIEDTAVSRNLRIIFLEDYYLSVKI